MSIEQRRHDAARIKARRKGYYGGWASSSPTQLGIVLHTAARCSCYACGNPRKYFEERTTQERRMFQEAA